MQMLYMMQKNQQSNYNNANQTIPNNVIHQADNLIIAHQKKNIQYYENERDDLTQIKDTYNLTTKVLESSKKEIIDLQKISRKDLKKHKTYINKILIGKIILKPYKLTGIHCLIEDEFGLLIKISFYNFKVKRKKEINKLFFVGQKICIIEPYIKFNNGSFCRVDNPSNVVFNYEKPNDLLSSLKLKERGNFFFIKKNYQMAILYYSEAIKKNNKNPLIFSNRAIARINEKLFLEAIKDCDKAILLDNKNPKFFYRKAIALKNLHFYKEALKSLLKTKGLKEINLLKKVITQRIEEKEKGNYNLNELFEHPFKINENLSDFIGSIKIIKIKNKGRGIIATKDIKKGELISATKSFGFGKMDKKTKDIVFEFYKGGVRKEDTQKIYYTAINKLDESPLNRLRFSFLYGGLDTKIVDINI